jgi:hypothetical protein
MDGDGSGAWEDVEACEPGFNGGDCHPTSVYNADKVITALVFWSVVAWCVGMQYLGNSRQVLLDVHKEEHTKLAQLTENERIRHKRSKTLAQSALELWSLSNEQVAGITGTDGGLYLTLLRGAALFFCAYAGVGVFVLVPLYFSGNLQSRSLLSFTIVNTSQSTSQRWMVLLAQMGATVATYAFMFIMWKRMQRFKYRAETLHKSFTEAHHTVMIRHLPDNISRTVLWEKMEQIMERKGDILDVQCELELADVVIAERKLDQATRSTRRAYLRQRQRAEESDGRRCDCRYTYCGGKQYLQQQLRRERRRVRNLRKKVTRLNARPVVGTGTAYIAFTTIAAAQDFVDEFRLLSRQERVDRYYLPVAPPEDCHSHNEFAIYRHEAHQQMMFLARGERDWKVKMAPRPDDILWENTKFTARSHRRRQTIAELVVLCLVAVLTILVITIVLIVGLAYVSYRFDIEATEVDASEHPVRALLTSTLSRLQSSLGIFYGVVILVPPALFVALKSFSAKLLMSLSHFEKFATASQREEGYLGKSFQIFLVLNVVLPTMSYSLLSRWTHVGDPLTIFAEFSSSSAINVLLIEALFYNPLRILLGLDMYRYRKWKDRREAVMAMHEEHASNARKRWKTAGNALGALGRLRRPDGDVGDDAAAGDDEDDDGAGAGAGAAGAEPGAEPGAESASPSPRNTSSSGISELRESIHQPAALDVEDDDDDWDQAWHEWDVLEAPPPFDLSRNYAEVLSFFGTALSYALVCPLILPAAALYFTSKYWTDKYIMVRQYGKAVKMPQFTRRVRAVNKYLCLVVALSQLWPCYYFYYAGKLGEQALSFTLLVFTSLCSLSIFFRKFKIAGREIDLFACEELEESIGKSDGWLYSEEEKLRTRELKLPYMPPPGESFEDLTARQKMELEVALASELARESEAAHQTEAEHERKRSRKKEKKNKQRETMRRQAEADLRASGRASFAEACPAWDGSEMDLVAAPGNDRETFEMEDVGDARQQATKSKAKPKAKGKSKGGSGNGGSRRGRRLRKKSSVDKPLSPSTTRDTDGGMGAAAGVFGAADRAAGLESGGSDAAGGDDSAEARLAAISLELGVASNPLRDDDA